MNKTGRGRALKGWMPIGILVVIGLILILMIRPGQEPPVKASLEGFQLMSPGEFARATGPLPFNFPRDHGSHPDFQTEWWYYTGNLHTAEGRRFGYQLTFFRRALTPEQESMNPVSAWRTRQVYLAHFALTDASSNQFRSFERWSRGAAGLAGADGEPLFGVWLEDWSVQQTAEGRYNLTAHQDDLGIDLLLVERKAPVLQGDQGYSQKGPQPGNASYYYSLTSLETKGTISLPDGQLQVSGTSWMDHEWSTSALSEGQVGWDWFALQFSNDMELMVYTIRRADGSLDPYSRGTLVYADGSSLSLETGDFSIQNLDIWKSPHSGGNYPSQWEIRLPDEGLSIQVTPIIQDQENVLTFTYWEGGVDVRGLMQGKAISGFGYVELTGYSGSLAGQF